MNLGAKTLKRPKAITLRDKGKDGSLKGKSIVWKFRVKFACQSVALATLNNLEPKAFKKTENAKMDKCWDGHLATSDPSFLNLDRI